MTEQWKWEYTSFFAKEWKGNGTEKIKVTRKFQVICSDEWRGWVSNSSP